MQNSQPFKRANTMMAAIAAAMAFGSQHLQQAAIAGLGQYESRGKGKGGNNVIGSARHGAGMASIRAARKARNVRRHRKMVKG